MSKAFTPLLLIDDGRDCDTAFDRCPLTPSRYRLVWIGIAALSVMGCFGHHAAAPAPSAERTPCEKGPAQTGQLPQTVVQSTTVEPPETPKASNAQAPTTSNEDRILTSFDCFSAMEGKRDGSLRAWHSGGPSGAAWNIDGEPIICTLGWESPCNGVVHFELFGNAHAFEKSSSRTLLAGRSQWNIEIAARKWAAAMNSFELAYETLVLAVGGILVCNEDYDQHPFADAFIMGTASGE